MALEEGYVGAQIEGAFDAGAYSFFGDMAPLDESLGGALEDGLEAPPEEWPAEGALEDDDDLPIEALMDDQEDEDEDLSLVALLGRQLQVQGGATAASSSSKQLAQQQLPSSLDAPANGFASSKDERTAAPAGAAPTPAKQHGQPLLPPMPPQPAMLAHLGAQPAAAKPGSLTAADADAAHAAALAAAAPAGRPVAPKTMMTAADLEARILSSAAQAQQQQQQQASGGALLSMLKGKAPPAGQQPQQHTSPLHSRPGAAPPGFQPLPGMAGGSRAPAGPGPGSAGGFSPGPGPLLPHQPGPLGMPPPLQAALLPGQQLQEQGQPGQQQQLLPPFPGQQHPGFLGGVPRPPSGGPGTMPPGPGMPHPGMGLGLPPPPHLQQQQHPGQMPGQLMAPRGMPGPPFPGSLPPHHLHQQQPQLPGPHGFKGPLPPQHDPQQLAAALAAGPQQQQHPGMLAGPSPPRQRSPGPGGWLPGSGPQPQPRAVPGMPGVLLHPSPPGQQQRYPSPGGGFGGGFDPSAAAAGGGGVSGGGGAAAGVSPAALVARLRSCGSELMAADEINYILRIQHMATHGQHPYHEDFYYQAFLNKYCGGRNLMVFAPQQLRDLLADSAGFGGVLGGSSGGGQGGGPRFADLSGLGKVVLSNIRTPKALMDLSSGGSRAAQAQRAAGSGGQQQQQQEEAGADEGRARPLEQEPMLAARIMIEDCMLLLSDVEDIDRTFAAAAAASGAAAAGMPPPPGAPGPIGPAAAASLLHRRAALLGGIAASFRLPDAPTVSQEAAAAAAASGGSAPGDGVFLRVMALPKGRALVAKTLRLLFSAPPAVAAAAAGGQAQQRPAANGDAAAGDSSSNGGGGSGSSAAVGLDVIWALLRHADVAFGPPVAVTAAGAGGWEQRMTDATIALSAAASEKVKRLTRPEDAVGCLAACLAGLAAAGAAADNGGNGGGAAAQLLPLFPAGRVAPDASPDWLGSILASLLLRASELGLGSFAASGKQASLREGYRTAAKQEPAAAAGEQQQGDGQQDKGEQQQQQEEEEEDDDDEAGQGEAAAAAAVAPQWAALLGRLTQLVMLHLWALIQLSRGEGVVAAAAAGSAGLAGELRPYVQKLSCVPLMRVLMAHCDGEQREQLRSYLSELAH